jgi:hypothetical protein
MKMSTANLAALMAAAVLVSGLGASAQTPIYYTPGYTAAPPVPQYQDTSAPTALAPEQLDQLLGPIALYPDPLLSEVLAAATYPDDLATAAQWLQSFPTPSEQDIDAQPWDSSVKALVHYPTVVQMLASQPDWTATLGSAFAAQPQDVMASIQRLRAEAEAAHTLASNDQQQVVTDNGDIEVLPAQPDVIYVPSYDPGVVYVGNAGYNQPWITFSAGFPVGAWLDLGWDWHGRHINRGVNWGRDWRHPIFNHPQAWTHNPGRPLPRPHFPVTRPHGIEPGRGFGPPDHRPGPAFDPHLAPRPGERPGVPGHERPVAGIPPHAPVAPHRPVAPHPAAKPAPMPQFHPPTPQRSDPFQHGPQAERNVIGIPRPAPAPIAHPATPIGHAPPPAVHAAPPPAVHAVPPPAMHTAPPAAQHAAPVRSPAFHGDGGGAAVQSARGHGSMHR